MQEALAFKTCAIPQRPATITSSVGSVVDEDQSTNSANQETPSALHRDDKKEDEFAVIQCGDEDMTVAESSPLKKAANALDPETLDRLHAAADLVLNNLISTMFDDELADAIAYLYANHLPLRDVFNHSRNGVNRSESLTQSTEYFWKSIDRVRRPDYIPTEEDIMNLRCQSTGSVVWPF